MDHTQIKTILRVCEIRVSRQLRQVKAAEKQSDFTKQKLVEAKDHVDNAHQIWSTEKKQLQEDLFTQAFKVNEIQKRRDKVIDKEKVVELAKKEVDNCMMNLNKTTEHLKHEQKILLEQRKRFEKMKEARVFLEEV